MQQLDIYKDSLGKSLWYCWEATNYDTLDIKKCWGHFVSTVYSRVTISQANYQCIIIRHVLTCALPRWPMVKHLFIKIKHYPFLKSRPPLNGRQHPVHPSVSLFGQVHLLFRENKGVCSSVIPGCGNLVSKRALGMYCAPINVGLRHWRLMFVFLLNISFHLLSYFKEISFLCLDLDNNYS